MKKTLSALAAGALLSVAGLASAAEPLQLTDNQMDSVSAGAQGSVATTGGFALFGSTASVATTSSYSRTTWFSVTRTTSAGAGTISSGVVAVAGASAGSSF